MVGTETIEGTVNQYTGQPGRQDLIVDLRTAPHEYRGAYVRFDPADPHGVTFAGVRITNAAALAAALQSSPPVVRAVIHRRGDLYGAATRAEFTPEEG